MIDCITTALGIIKKISSDPATCVKCSRWILCGRPHNFLNCVNFCEVHGRKILISIVKRMLLASNRNAMFAVRVLEWIAASWTPYPISVHRVIELEGEAFTSISQFLLELNHLIRAGG